MTAGVPTSVAEAFAGVEGLVALLLAGAVLAWPWRSTALPAGLDSSARLAGPVPGATRPRSARAVGRRHGIPGAPAAPAIADALELVALVLGAGGGLVDAVEAVVDCAAAEDVRDGRARVEHALNARVLRQVAEAALADDLACHRLSGATEHLEQAGLARTIATHQTDFFA